MVPSRTPRALHGRTAPRTRGDGPGTADSADRLRLCSPHPRGWSRRVRDPCVRRRLLPAPAGMVPTRPGGSVTDPTAPRTRGDGPSWMTSAAWSMSCSPHPRGWSRVRGHQQGAGRLLPAPAGMVPDISTPLLPPAPAPRTRGDGPASFDCRYTTVGCSPHPRGWSHRARFGDLFPVLLPAPAGMVPRGTARSRSEPPAPRTRGDGPTPHARILIGPSCSPHPRGGPTGCRRRPSFSRCSPHPRGWSRAISSTDETRQLLPAPAGMMVPGPTSRRRAEPPAPRTRGDGPAVGGESLPEMHCSPHLRGWSPLVAKSAEPVRLLPAPAGMFPSTSGNGVMGRLRVRQPCSMPHPAVVVWTGTIRGGACPDRSHAAWTGHQPPRSMSGTGGGHRQRHVSGFGHSRGYGAGS